MKPINNLFYELSKGKAFGKNTTRGTRVEIFSKTGGLALPCESEKISLCSVLFY